MTDCIELIELSHFVSGLIGFGLGWGCVAMLALLVKLAGERE